MNEEFTEADARYWWDEAAKKDVLIRSLRAAVKDAADTCDFYGPGILFAERLAARMKAALHPEYCYNLGHTWVPPNCRNCGKLTQPLEKLCRHCGQPMLPKGRKKKPGEFDHAQGCPYARPR